MALIRDNAVIVAREEVSAQYSNIKGFSVDIASKKVVVDMEYGNIAGGKFVPVQARQHVIADKPAMSQNYEEKISVSAGRAVLAHTPTANLRVSAAGRLLFEGQDYTRNGNSLTLLSVQDGVELSISYGYEIPATLDFTGIVATQADGTKNLYGSIKAILWGKLIELGYEKGVVQ